MPSRTSQVALERRGSPKVIDIVIRDL